MGVLIQTNRCKDTLSIIFPLIKKVAYDERNLCFSVITQQQSLFNITRECSCRRLVFVITNVSSQYMFGSNIHYVQIWMYNWITHNRWFIIKRKHVVFWEQRILISYYTYTHSLDIIICDLYYVSGELFFHVIIHNVHLKLLDKW